MCVDAETDGVTVDDVAPSLVLSLALSLSLHACACTCGCVCGLLARMSVLALVNECACACKGISILF